MDKILTANGRNPRRIYEGRQGKGSANRARQDFIGWNVFAD